LCIDSQVDTLRRATFHPTIHLSVAVHDAIYPKVTGFEKGVLDCESLERAEDADELRFVLTDGEVGKPFRERSVFGVDSGTGGHFQCHHLYGIHDASVHIPF